MRKIAIIKKPVDNYRRLMISPCEGGCRLYFYETLDDNHCESEVICYNVEEAIDFAREEFGVDINDWKDIPKAKENCYDDRIKDVPRKR